MDCLSNGETINWETINTILNIHALLNSNIYFTFFCYNYSPNVDKAYLCLRAYVDGVK